MSLKQRFNQHGGRHGQVTLEYFILFAAIIVVTLLGVITLHSDIAPGFANVFRKFADKVTLDP